MAEGLFSSAHFEVRIEAGRRAEARRLGLCFVGPLSNETRDDPAGRPSSGPAPVVLRRALSDDRFLFDWRQGVADGKDDPRSVTLRLFSGADRQRTVELRLEGCRPTRWSGPRLDAVDGGVALEEIELAYDKLIWV